MPFVIPCTRPLEADLHYMCSSTHSDLHDPRVVAADEYCGRRRVKEDTVDENAVGELVKPVESKIADLETKIDLILREFDIASRSQPVKRKPAQEPTMGAELSDHFELNFSDEIVCAPVLYGGRASDENVVAVLSMRVWT